MAVTQRSIALSPILLMFLGHLSSVLAQVIPDATLGLESSQLQLQGNQITIEGGANSGLALFHSFDQFNVADGQQVFFANPQGIDAILSRVTGTTPSNLDGTLGVLGPADLFLLNPNGILFGPNAQLDLPGSFTASTANSLQIGDVTFSATAPAPVPLLAINVLPGIQFGTNAPDRLIQNQANLTLVPQQQLSFDGGTIDQAGQITIPGGTVDLRGSTLSLTGEINTRTADNQFGLLRLSSPTDLTIEATAPLTNQAVSQALENNEVVVGSDRNLTLIGPISSNSLAPLTLRTDDNLNLLGDGTGDASTLSANVTLQSGGDIRITNPFIVSVTQGIPQLTIQAIGDIILQPNGLSLGPNLGLIEFTGNGGSLSIEANSLTASDAGNVLALVSGVGTSPTIDVVVAQDLILERSVLNTRADNGQTTGDIRIRAGQSVQLLTGFVGTVPLMGAFARTGDIDIQAADTILLQSSLIQTQANAGDAGDINLSARQITLDGSMGQSLIAADTQILSIGDAGNITLNATESIELIGDVPGPFIIIDPQQLGLTGVIARGFGETTIQATAFGLGASGKIEVNTDRLTLRDGALLVNATGLFGNVSEAGDIVVNANDIQLRGQSAIATGTTGNEDAGRLEINSDRIHLEDGATIAVSSLFGAGDAGELILRTNDLVVTGGSAILANSLAGGGSGLLDIQAQSITIEGTSADDSFSSSLLTDVSPTSTGPGGPLNIQTNNLDVLNGGQIRASTQGSENAGSLNITADQVTVSGASPSNIPSTIEAESTGTGDAGDIRLEADRLTIRDNAAVSTQSLQGSGGDIFLVLDEVLLLRQQGEISATAGVSGTEGDGGNIDINTGFIVGPATENSDITANAFLGSGGSVTVGTNALLGIAFRDQTTGLSDITASSAVGLDGTVVIEQVVDEIESDSVELPDSLVSDNDRLTAGCLLDEDASFVATGRGGIPASSGEQLNQSLIWTDPRGTATPEEAASPNDGTSSEPSALVEAQKWQIDGQGQVELVTTINTFSPQPSCQQLERLTP